MSRSKSYAISSLMKTGPEMIEALVIFDPGHPIYAGHFPGNPVTPGVCIVGMVGDLLNAALNAQYFMSEARMIKFHNPLKPVEDHQVKVEMTYRSVEADMVSLKAVVSDDEVKYCSLNASYRVAT